MELVDEASAGDISLYHSRHGIMWAPGATRAVAFKSTVRDATCYASGLGKITIKRLCLSVHPKQIENLKL
jgi:hypothetical protein